jgi:long-chain acyl-CoA synthetase
MRQKELGIWREHTWKDYHEGVKYLCLGLKSLGLEPEQKVSIIGDNDPQWYWAEIATMAGGGVAVGIDVEATPQQIEYIMIARDQEQVDKLWSGLSWTSLRRKKQPLSSLEIKNKLPTLKKVIYWQSKGLTSYEDPLLMSLDEVMELGRQQEEEQPGIFEREVERGTGKDVALIAYTPEAATTPMGAMLSHNNMISAARGFHEINPSYESDEHFSFLSPTQDIEQIAGIASSLVSSFKVNFPESPETVPLDMREIAPERMVYPAMILEAIYSMMQSQLVDASFLKRSTYRLCLLIGYKMADLHLAGQRANPFLRAPYGLANLMAFRGIRDRLGMAKCRLVVTAGGVSPDVYRWFYAIGAKVTQGYGPPEAPSATAQRLADSRPESVGKPIAGVEIRISEDGEVLVKGDTVFQGYYKDPEATGLKLRDGWLHTGDSGHFDEGGNLVLHKRPEPDTGTAGKD